MDDTFSFFSIISRLSDQVLISGLCEITNICSKYSLILIKNSPTISKFSSAIFPNTSSITTMFGFGNDETLVNTLLSAKDAIVLSYPEPA